MSASTLLTVALALGAPPQETELTQASIDAIRELVLPTAEELSYERIPWIPSFAEGIHRASEEGRPLLFWAMNGHPLGCT